MKHFYQINLVKEGRHTWQIVKAETEAEARAMMPEDHEIILVKNKGPVEE